ncbi:hypothetical protein CEXT_301191 [Caerostris extrusa]|uniref:Uncharacterized protein n=1 Tax=Caerostris extrusa TaxID=172846 RepID=A0AAV4RE70_CAEEX|nr:hypothetical protein CEXT_301191 [Caerostris extrusa]
MARPGLDHPGIYSPSPPLRRRGRNNPHSPFPGKSCLSEIFRTTNRESEGEFPGKKMGKKMLRRRLPDFLPCLCAVCGGPPRGFFCGASAEKQTSIYSFSRVYISSSNFRDSEKNGIT